MLALFVICFVALFQLQETSVHDKVSFILSTPEMKNFRIQATNMTYLSRFNSGMPLKVIIHGEAFDDPQWVQDARDGYQTKGGLNVILVDWSMISSVRPLRTPRIIIDVAEPVTDMIKEWYSYCIHSLNDVHIVAFAEAAHIAGIVGYTIKEHFKIPIGRITGLDPERYDAHSRRPEHKLDPSDAVFVDIIHTDGWGPNGVSIGSIDFMPQGGFSPQPNCGIRGSEPGDNKDLLAWCSKRISREYFVESINSLAFLATQCEDYDKFEKKECEERDTAIMGENVDMSQRGRFYLYVGDKSPYGLYGDSQ